MLGGLIGLVLGGLWLYACFNVFKWLVGVLYRILY